MNSPAVSENLRSAFSAAVDRELELALASCPAFAPSAGFGERMEKLIWEEKRPVRRLLNSRVKRAAAALIAAAMMLCFLGFTSERIRSSVAGFFVQVFGDHTEYSDPAITKTSIEEEYGLVPVPEGFEEAATVKEDGFIRINYHRSSDDSDIFLTQSTIDTHPSVDNEHGETTECKVGENWVLIYRADSIGYFSASWMMDGYFFNVIYQYDASYPFDLEQFKNIVASVNIN